MFVDVENVRLYCDSRGDGEPVLFIHGFPLTGEMWRETEERLSDRWRCIVPDLRGHGQSAASPAASMARYADDLVAVLDKLCEWRPVTVVGLSMGGYIAFEFFRRHRGRTRALVLCDTRATADTPEAAAQREATARNVLQKGSRLVADAMIDGLFAPQAPQTIKQRWLDLMSKNPPMGVAAALRAMAARPDSTPTLSKIDCPALLVVGREDAITPVARTEEMKRAIPGARIEIVEGAGHMTPVEQPDAFTNVLREFLISLN